MQYLVAVGEGDYWYDDRVFPNRDLVAKATPRRAARSRPRAYSSRATS